VAPPAQAGGLSFSCRDGSLARAALRGGALFLSLPALNRGLCGCLRRASTGENLATLGGRRQNEFSEIGQCSIGAGVTVIVGPKAGRAAAFQPHRAFLPARNLAPAHQVEFSNIQLTDFGGVHFMLPLM